MRRKAVWSAVLTLALGVPVLAAAASRDTAEQAAQRIESARVSIEAAAAQQAAPVERRGGRSYRTVKLERAQMELGFARERYEQADFAEARKHADRAAWLAWKASDPRKGEK